VPRILKRLIKPVPPATVWPPKEGDPENQVILVAHTKLDGELQDVWVRWHAGDDPRSLAKGWQISLIPAQRLEYLRAYWAMTGLHVAVSA
jgi:hypothetical protein